MPSRAGTRLVPEGALNTIKERFRDERLVAAGKCFAGAPEADQSDVKRIVQNHGQAAHGYSASIPVSDPKRAISSARPCRL